MMRWIYKLPLRLRSLFRKNRVEDDLSVELRFHLEKQIEQNVATGMSAEEARYAALRAFGGVEQAKEECRDAWSVRFINEIAQDLRYGLRQLRRSPGFTAVAVLTLALGIGANVAIFSLINQTLLRSLPVQHPNQLVVLSSTELKAGTTDAEYSGAAIFSYPMYKDLRENNRAFSGLLASYPHADVNVSWHGQAERASAELVSGNFFQVLGVRPALGRVFSQADETAPGANPVVVLNYGYWKRHFGGGPAVLNQTLDINATDLTVAGVAQAGFTGDEAGAAPDLYVPITMNAQMAPNGNRLNEVSDYFLALIGRLKPGMSRLRAQAELQPAFHAILEAELPIVTANKDIISAGDRKRFLTGKIELTPGAQGRPVLQTFLPAPMAILMGMVGLVLLIACANLASLLLARGEARQHEIAVRLAVGESRSRLIRQLLTEGLILAVAGGGAGLLIGWWTLRLIIYALPGVPLVAVFLSGVTANLEPHVLVFCAGATILSLQFFGLLPALKASRADLQTSLKEQGASTSGGAGSVRLRKLLVVGQVGSAVTLLVAAGLFGESLVRLERENVGMRIDHVVQFSIDPGLGGYSPAKTVALFNRLRRNIAALPGVSSVAAAQVPLLAGSNTSDTMKFQDFAPAKNVDTTVGVNYVSPRFFSTLGTPLIEGREFRASDSASSPQVAIINEKVAREFFPGHNPVGMHLAIGSGPDVHPNIEIAGVVANTKNVDPSDPDSPFVYFPYTQDEGLGSGTFYVRTRTEPGAMTTALRKVAAQDAPNLPLYNVRTMTEQFSDSMFSERWLAFFTLSLAVLAALLAAVGLYGVMAYAVVRRTREIAIRLALGAEKNDVLGMIIGQGFKLTLIGIAIGIGGAFALTRFLSSLLYGVKPTDTLTFIAVALILTAVALLACYIPARRATKVDPMVALRYE